MKNTKHLIAGLLQTLGVIAYCTGIAAFFWYSNDFFVETPEIFVGMFILFLLVFSAAITGLIVFGYPIHLVLKKKIKDALFVLAYTMLCSVIFMIVSLAYLFSVG